MFHYSSYWGIWSRVLWVDSKGYVDLNLTPIPGCYSSTWDTDVKGEVIRCHGTSRGERDKVVDILPQKVMDEMVRNLGKDLTQRLLTHDYIAQFGLENIRSAKNPHGGGVAFGNLC